MREQESMTNFRVAPPGLWSVHALWREARGHAPEAWTVEESTAGHGDWKQDSVQVGSAGWPSTWGHGSTVA